MLMKILRGLFTLIGLAVGFLVGQVLLKIDQIVNFFKINTKGFNAGIFIYYVIFILLFGLIFFLLAPVLNRLITKGILLLEKRFQDISAIDIVYGTVGGLIGLIISVLIISIIGSRNSIVIIIEVIASILTAFFGADIATKKREEFSEFFQSIRKGTTVKEKKPKSKGIPKVLDTSVIIDGRIFDICQTGFIEGTLVIPTFVLQELRHIADSSDSLKRNRGRRGLDVLNKIQNELNIDVTIYEKDFPDIAEVDAKLLKLAQVLNGKVITNDYNLNKVAQFQKVPVLNINELANAVKPVVLPGEEMRIQIVKDGKENGQGIAYLDDGTMIVVEGGRKHIGDVVDVLVTSVLQTAAGRMIFAKPKELA